MSSNVVAMHKPARPVLFLNAAHFEHCNKTSGLSEETLRMAGVVTIRETRHILQALNRKGKEAEKFAKNLGECIAFPCRHPETVETLGHVLRPDNPPDNTDEKTGKVKLDKEGKPKKQKYLGPARKPSLVMFGPRTINERRFSDSARELIFTEGQKKALLIDQVAEGAVIGLQGARNAHDTSVGKTAKGERREVYELLPVIKENVRIKGAHCVIVFDLDARANKSVEVGIYLLARMLRDAGAASVRIALPDLPAELRAFADPNDLPKGIDDVFVFARDRSDEGQARRVVREIIAGGESVDYASLDALIDHLRDQESAEGAAKRRTGDDRVEIVVGPRQHEVADAALAALVRDPALYVQQGKLVRVLQAKGADRPAKRADNDNADNDNADNDNAAQKSQLIIAEGALQVDRVPKENLTERLSRVAGFVRKDGEKFVPCTVPSWLPGMLLTRGVYDELRELEGVVQCPMMRPDGTVLDVPGYDPATRLVLSSREEWPRVKERPTPDEARAAARVFFRLTEQFPFVTPEDQAAWLAAALTPLARAAIAGPVPCMVVDSATPGTGKSLLADLAFILAAGRRVSTMIYTGNAEETDKRLLAIGLAGLPIVLLDNLKVPLGDASLDSALTSTDYTGRILKESQMAAVPMRTTFFATGNNVKFASDSHRRVLVIRLESLLERPENRTDLLDSDIAGSFLRNRPQLVNLGLTILRAHALDGWPRMGIAPWHSYESWVGVVAAAVKYATGIDPTGVRRRMASAASAGDDLAGLKSLLEAMRRAGVLQGRKMTGLQMLSRSSVGDEAGARLKEAIAEICPTQGDKPVGTRQLGNRLRDLRTRVVVLDDGRWRIGAEEKDGQNAWFAERVAEPEPARLNGGGHHQGRDVGCEGMLLGLSSISPETSLSDDHLSDESDSTGKHIPSHPTSRLCEGGEHVDGEDDWEIM